MAQSLETKLTERGLEYHHRTYGYIGHKVYNLNGYWGFCPDEGIPTEICRDIFGQTAELMNSETADWLALAIASEMEGRGH